jgi:HAD superfamily hydrolase (TIGR01509 family)
MTVAKIELVIFDCDGVLIDSEDLSAAVLLELFSALGANLDQQYFHKNCLGRSFQELAKRFKVNTGITLPDDFEQSFRTKLLARFVQDLKPIAGAEEVLNRLNLPFCVATGSHRLRAESALQSAGLFEIVKDRLYTADLVVHGKPAPDLFLYAAKKHNFAPENCLVIEDSDIGIEAAQAAGMPVWRFTGGSHMQSLFIRPAANLGPVFTFSDLSTLPALLTQKC